MHDEILKDFPFALKDNEEIKQIDEFPDYWISNYGRIFRYKIKKEYCWKEFKGSFDKYGHKRANLTNNAQSKAFGVAQLVFKYFRGDLKPNCCICFKDNDKNNCYYKNLEQKTRSEVARYNRINEFSNEYKAIDDCTLQGTTRRGETFLIDKEDYELVKSYCWHRHQDGYMRTRISFYKDENGKVHNSYILMHNLIMGKREGLELDHLNGNPADNRKINLQYKTHLQNMDNIASHTNGRIKGAHFSKREHKWKVTIISNNKKYYLGTFEKYEDAENAILSKRKELGLKERRKG